MFIQIMIQKANKKGKNNKNLQTNIVHICERSVLMLIYELNVPL